MRIVAAILAAGSGVRFGSDKVLQPLNGKLLWRWSFETFRACPEVDEVGLVCSKSNIEAIRLEADGAAFVIQGGASRQESVRRALEACGDADVLLLHDAARPYVSSPLITNVVRAAVQAGAAAPAVPVKDTIRMQNGSSANLIDRSKLVAMQTPQGVGTDILRKAFAETQEEFTDDIALAEAVGVTPLLVPGEETNIKITHRMDIPRGIEARTGMGYDVHAFSEDSDQTLFLGGVEFAAHRGLEGHSDADPLLHAIVDALLGAAGLGDIGVHFPPSDPQWKDVRSTHFLRHAGGLINGAGWRILNIDATVIAESPRIMSRAKDIRRSISEELLIPIERINIKATTNEHLGFIGRGEGIAAFAIATLAAAQGGD